MKDVLGEELIEVNSKKEAVGGLPGYEDLPPEEQNKKLQEMFRRVFSGEEGKTVLTVILEDLYYFAPCTNDEARALSNYAKTLLSSRLRVNNNKEIVDKLMSM